ncbi:MAG TPA: TonB family protein [Pyrinomonadaceae bacterium]|nr:TonB family protein [Pyrinomonadaceae bacterium]
MSRFLAMLAFSAGILTAFNSTTFSQTNLTAKATLPQPAPAAVISESDRTRDGLMGPVRRVRTEVAKLLNESGKVTEAKHAVLEVVAYDQNGAKIENQYFPIAGATLTGKEVYKYDEKGNISEMTLLNADGSLMSKETYKYEYDFAGNWNKMTTSVAVFEGGKLSFEPTEVTYRSIMYYLDDKILRMAQPQTAAANTPSSSSANTPVAKSPDTKNVAALPNAINPDKLNSNSIDFANKNVATGSQPVTVKLDSEPPPAAPKPMLRPVSGGVLNGTAVSLPPPTYPEAAKRMRQSGVVTVNVIVDETGKVISAQASDGPAALREVAVQAALRARFSPTKLSGQPVKVSGMINYKFSLTQ